MLEWCSSLEAVKQQAKLIPPSAPKIDDWEGDTIIGKGHSGAIVSLVDRVFRYTLLRQLPSKHAEPVRDAIIDLLSPFKSRALTITFDNGLEFAKHEDMTKALDADVYFAHPYHSWERGLNERMALCEISWVTEFEFTTEEVNHIDVVGHISIAPSASFSQLNLAVNAFQYSIGDLRLDEIDCGQSEAVA